LDRKVPAVIRPL
jgi:hypothetical protein